MPQIGYKTLRQPDGDWTVVLGTRIVARGFKNRTAALSYIAELMDAHIQKGKKG